MDLRVSSKVLDSAERAGVPVFANCPRCNSELALDPSCISTCERCGTPITVKRHDKKIRDAEIMALTKDVSTEGLAHILCQTRQAVLAAVTRGRLVGYKRRGRWRFTPQAVKEAYL